MGPSANQGMLLRPTEWRSRDGLLSNEREKRSRQRLIKNVVQNRPQSHPEPASNRANHHVSCLWARAG